MIKSLYFLLFLICVNTISIAQENYTSKSGHVFKVGEKITLGQPTIISSSPLMSTSGEWKTIFNKKGKAVTNMKFIDKSGEITKIDQTNEKVKVYFKLYSRVFYSIIEESIIKNEVIISGNNKVSSNSLDKYDKIKKLKELLDIGAITEEEFKSEKTKLLNN